MATIVFVHSSGSSARLWDPVTTLLADRYRTVAPDLPGHGARPGPFTMEGAVAAVRGALPAEPVHLVGISLGATVAVLTCLAEPGRIASLVLSGGIAHPPALLVVQRLVMTLLPERAMAAVVGHEDPGLVPQFRQAGKATALVALREIAAVDLRPRLPDITVPALVLVGERDRVNHPGARELAAGLPRSKHLVVPDAGHLWCLTAPERFAAIVGEFVEASDKPGAPGEPA